MDIFKGVLNNDPLNYQDVDFGISRVGETTAIDQRLLNADPAAFIKNDDMLDREELLIKQQQAQMLQQIADTEKERKINFQLKQEQIEDDIREQQFYIVKKQRTNN